MDNFVIFTSQELGYDRDEVSAYIARIHREYEEVAAKYEALLKAHERLDKKYQALSEKRKS